MSLQLAKKNEQLGNIPEFYLPNESVIKGICGKATPLCKRYCYGNGWFRHPKDENKQILSTEVIALENYRVSQTDTFIEDMCTLLDGVHEQNFRIHSVGEFYSYDYFLKWIEVMKRKPDIVFTAYVKVFDILKKYKDSRQMVPSNFNLLLSIYPDTWDSYKDDGGSGRSYVESLIQELLEYYHAKLYIVCSKEEFVSRLNDHGENQFFCGTKTSSLFKNVKFNEDNLEVLLDEQKCDECLQCYSSEKCPPGSEIYAYLRVSGGAANLEKGIKELKKKNEDISFPELEKELLKYKEEK